MLLYGSGCCKELPLCVGGDGLPLFGWFIWACITPAATCKIVDVLGTLVVDRDDLRYGQPPQFERHCHILVAIKMIREIQRLLSDTLIYVAAVPMVDLHKTRTAVAMGTWVSCTLLVNHSTYNVGRHLWDVEWDKDMGSELQWLTPLEAAASAWVGYKYQHRMNKKCQN